MSGDVSRFDESSSAFALGAHPDHEHDERDEQQDD